MPFLEFTSSNNNVTGVKGCRVMIRKRVTAKIIYRIFCESCNSHRTYTECCDKASAPMLSDPSLLLRNLSIRKLLIITSQSMAVKTY